MERFLNPVELSPISVGEGRQNLQRYWTNYLSITIKRTNQMCDSLTLVLYHCLTHANRCAPQSSEAKQYCSLWQIFNAFYIFIFYYCESAFQFDKNCHQCSMHTKQQLLFTTHGSAFFSWSCSEQLSFCCSHLPPLYPFKKLIKDWLKTLSLKVGKMDVEIPEIKSCRSSCCARLHHVIRKEKSCEPCTALIQHYKYSFLTRANLIDELCLPPKICKQRPRPLCLRADDAQRHLERHIYLLLRRDECLNNNHFLLPQLCMFEEPGRPSV